jgi:zinc transport system substrate-binding protein
MRFFPHLGRLPFLLLPLLFALPAAAARADAVPQVVVTIKPLHSLVAAVMAGVAEPGLLISGAGSPHSYSLRPSDARLLAHADLVIRIDADFETFLNRPLASLAKTARILSVSTLPGVELLPARKGGVWEADHHAEEAAGQDHAEMNLHLWLDPHNARAIVKGTVTVLAAMDPRHAAAYRRNGADLEARLERLDRQLAGQLQPLAGVPYIVFHDAYPYLEHRYGLSPVGAISVSPDRPPGARRLTEIRDRIEQSKARCVFSEPQFEPKLATLLSAGTGARSSVLDPLGADLPPGPEAYFTLLHDLADNLSRCLARPAPGREP